MSQLTSIAMAYNIRHVGPRKKQAKVATVCEEHVVRVASCGPEHAPVVAQVRVGDIGDRLTLGMRKLRGRYIAHDAYQAPRVGTTMHYRAARGGDGVVRLVAPLDSPALAMPEPRLAQRLAELPPHAGAGLFQHPSNNPADPLDYLPPGSDLGTLIASDRAAALARTTALAQTLVMVDGVLHAPCAEPGWWLSTRVDYAHGMGGPRCLVKACAFVDPMDSHAMADFLGYCHNLGQALAEEPQQYNYPIGRMEVDGEITELVEGALGGDYRWRMMRNLLGAAIHGQPETMQDMLESEQGLRARMVALLGCWPAQRTPGLVAEVVRTIRVVHGVRSSGNAEMLATALALEAQMERHGPPAPLEDRLAHAGVRLEHPDAPVALAR